MYRRNLRTVDALARFAELELGTTLAVVMPLALVGTGVLVAGGINAWWLVPTLAVVMTGVNLWRRGASWRY